MKLTQSKKRMINRFSLIEVLVVIAVLMVLFALLLPALRRAKEQSYKGKCASRIRQIGIGIELYTQDFGSYYPVDEWVGPAAALDPMEYWTVKIKDYLGDKNDNTEPIKMLACPGMLPEPDFEVNSNDRSNYMANENIFKFGGGGVNTSIKFREVVNPQETMLVMCGSSAAANPGSTEGALKSRCGLAVQIFDLTLRFPHPTTFQSSNMIFADLHVGNIRKADIPKIAGDVFWNPNAN